MDRCTNRRHRCISSAQCGTGFQCAVVHQHGKLSPRAQSLWASKSTNYSEKLSSIVWSLYHPVYAIDTICPSRFIETRPRPNKVGTGNLRQIIVLCVINIIAKINLENKQKRSNERFQCLCLRDCFFEGKMFFTFMSWKQTEKWSNNSEKDDLLEVFQLVQEVHK